MNEEKVMILKMLEQGKITSEEAAKLLEAVKEGRKAGVKEERKEPSFKQNTNDQRDSKWPQDMEEKMERLGRSFDVWARDFGKKVEILARDLEPKLQKATQTIVEKTAVVADKVSKTLADPEFSSKFQAGRNGKELSTEIKVFADAHNELYIHGKNGMVYVKGYNGDKITAKIIYVPKTDNSNIQFIQSGCRYYVSYDESDFVSVSIEAFVPEAMFKRLQVETSNSPISLEGVTIQELQGFTSCGRVDVKNVSASRIKINTSNAKVTLEKVEAHEVEVETSNSTIDTNMCDMQKVNLETSNATIQYRAYDLSRYENYTWHLETSNASIKLYVPDTEYIGYELKANTSLNGIQVGLPRLNYTQNERNYIEAKSSHFDHASKKIHISMDTSNAPIMINQ